MKKILILLVGVFIFSGCSAEYTITIDKNMIKDDVFVYDKLANYETSEQETYAANVLSDFQMGYEFYDKTFTLKDNKNGGYHFESYLKYDEFDSMSIVRKCYDDINVNTDSSIKISTTSQFLCFNYYDELDSVKVSLKTTYPVINTNADTVVDGVYMWNITKDNANDKPIYLELEKESPNYSGTAIVIILSMIGIFIIGAFITKTIKNISDKNKF